MDRNMTLLIDPGTRDLRFDSEGNMETVSGDITSAQAVRLTLLVYDGEFPFDIDHGVLYDRVLGKRTPELRDDEIAEVIRSGVFQESSVAQIDSLTATVDDKRRLNISLLGYLTSGASFSTEVVTG